MGSFFFLDKKHFERLKMAIQNYIYGSLFSYRKLFLDCTHARVFLFNFDRDVRNHVK